MNNLEYHGSLLDISLPVVTSQYHNMIKVVFQKYLATQLAYMF